MGRSKSTPVKQKNAEEDSYLGALGVQQEDASAAALAVQNSESGKAKAATKRGSLSDTDDEEDDIFSGSPSQQAKKRRLQTLARKRKRQAPLEDQDLFGAKIIASAFNGCLREDRKPKKKKKAVARDNLKTKKAATKKWEAQGCV